MSSLHPHHIIALILFFVSSLSVAGESTVFVAVSGFAVSLYPFWRHPPQLSHSAWSHILFKQNGDGCIVSHHTHVMFSIFHQSLAQFSKIRRYQAYSKIEHTVQHIRMMLTSGTKTAILLLMMHTLPSYNWKWTRQSIHCRFTTVKLRLHSAPYAVFS